MKIWINALAYQATWLASIAGAGRGLWWAGPLALSVFAVGQLAISAHRRDDAVLLACAGAIGFVVDSAFVQAGLLGFAAAWPWSHLAPIWIVTLWMSFALTLNHSLAYLKSHPLLAAALGAVGAPLAYWIAARAWHALVFVAAPALALAVVAVAWALLAPALCLLARHLARSLVASNPRGVGS
jgi:hypothetical protein